MGGGGGGELHIKSGVEGGPRRCNGEAPTLYLCGVTSVKGTVNRH